MMYQKEEWAREATYNYLNSLHQANPEFNTDNLMNINGGFVSRFDYFMPLVNSSARERLLVSGCAVGTELIVAKKYGFKQVYGTEVTTEYVRIAKERLIGDSSLQIDYYDGMNLPYSDNFFSMVYSGHVIEHTRAPDLYLKEHMRVLKKGGIFFIEFPDRYHKIELHTGLKSYEGLPYVFRNLVLHYLSKKSTGYKAILETLKPISVWQIRYYCLKARVKIKILDVQHPAPGYTRMLMMYL